MLLADEEDESELSALTVEPPDMHWANWEKDTTNILERMHNNTYQCSRNEGKACMQLKEMHNKDHCAGTRHYYAGRAWSCINFVRSVQYAPQRGAMAT